MPRSRWLTSRRPSRSFRRDPRRNIGRRKCDRCRSWWPGTRWSVAAGNHVFLHAERGDGEIVDHVFGRHRQLDGRIHRDVQFVDFAQPSGCWMCHIHCLPTTKISVAACGRPRIFEIEAGSPDENERRRSAWDDRPGEFERQVLLGILRDLIRRTAAVLDHEIENGGENQNGEKQSDRRQDNNRDGPRPRRWRKRRSGEWESRATAAATL